MVGLKRPNKQGLAAPQGYPIAAASARIWDSKYYGRMRSEDAGWQGQESRMKSIRLHSPTEVNKVQRFHPEIKYDLLFRLERGPPRPVVHAMACFQISASAPYRARR